VHLISQNRTSEHHGKEVGHFNILMKLRYALQLSVLFCTQNGSIYICSGYYVFGFFAWNHHLIVAMLPEDDIGKRWLVDLKNVRNLKKGKNSDCWTCI
jgi:hypothetical protein